MTFTRLCDVTNAGMVRVTMAGWMHLQLHYLWMFPTHRCKPSMKKSESAFACNDLNNI